MLGNESKDYSCRQSRPQHIEDQLLIEVSIGICSSEAMNLVSRVTFSYILQPEIELHLPLCNLIFLVCVTVSNIFVPDAIFLNWSSVLNQKPGSLSLLVVSSILFRE